MFGNMLMTTPQEEEGINLTEGLLAHYVLDGDAIDETGNYNGTEYNGATYISAGPYDSIAYLDGYNDYIKSDIETSSEVILFTAVLYNSGEGDSNPTIMMLEDMFELYLNISNKITMYSEWDGQTLFNYTLPEDTLVHIGVLIKDDDVKLYIDGLHEETEVFGISSGMTSTSFMIGGEESTYNLAGLFRHVRIYTEEKSDEFMLAIYNNDIAA